MTRHVHFADQVQVIVPFPINAHIIRYVLVQQPIQDEDTLANRKSPFQQQRIRMRQLLHLKHLERKAKRAARQTGTKSITKI